MTLVKCSECGKEVSNLAAACAHCGNPLPHGQAKELPTLRSILKPQRGKSSFGSRPRARKRHAASLVPLGKRQQKTSFHSPQRKRSFSLAEGGFILLLLFGLVIGFASRCASPSSTGSSRQASTPSGCSSNNCVIKAPTGGDVALAVSQRSLDEMMSGGTDKAIAVMVLNGSAFLVPQNTSVSIVDQGFGVRKVLVLEPGPTLGRTGWVPAEWVVDRK